MEELDEQGYAAYELTDADIAALCRWAAEWESDIRSRLLAGEVGPAGPPDGDWDAYLDR